MAIIFASEKVLSSKLYRNSALLPAFPAAWLADNARNVDLREIDILYGRKVWEVDSCCSLAGRTFILFTNKVKAEQCDSMTVWIQIHLSGAVEFRVPDRLPGVIVGGRGGEGKRSTFSWDVGRWKHTLWGSAQLNKRYMWCWKWLCCHKVAVINN